MQQQENKQVMIQGRIVYCIGKTLFEGKLKIDMNTKQPKLNKQNEQIIEHGFGLAVSKADLQPNTQGYALWMAMQEAAAAIYPSRQYPPGFAWKYKDGDGIDHNGKSFAEREGYAGCVVFNLSTTIPIKFFRHENGTNTLINDGIKCGDYVQVAVSVKAHGANGTAKPGLYLNPQAVLFLGYGKEIINSPSGDQIFGTVAPAMPPGASATPLVPAGGLQPSNFAPPMGQPQGFAPQNVAPQMIQQHQQPAPHYAVLPGQYQPQQQPAAAPTGFPQAGAPPQAAQPLAQHYPPTAAAPQQPPGMPVPGTPWQPQ